MAQPIVNIAAQVSQKKRGMSRLGMEESIDSLMRTVTSVSVIGDRIRHRRPTSRIDKQFVSNNFVLYSYLYDQLYVYRLT